VTLSSITLTADANPGATGSAVAAPIGGQIGAISASAEAKELTDVTAWGQSIVKSPILRDAVLSSGVSKSDLVTFSSTLDILNGAKSQRIPEYSVPG
jgi:hypothetical protein